MEERPPVGRPFWEEVRSISSATTLRLWPYPRAVCEVCWDPRLDQEKRERLPPSERGEDFWACEFHEEHMDGICSAPASWVIHFNFVENHLCDAHRAKIAEDLEGGLKEFLTAAGFGGEDTVVAIQGRERCEWTPDEPPFSDRECGRPARWAHVVAAETYICDEHIPAFDRDEEEARQRRAKERGKASHRR